MLNSKPNILVTGTPGVGKTTFSRLLVEYVDSLSFVNVGNIYSSNMFYALLILGDLIKEKKLYKKWDEEFDVPIFDEDMVCDALEPLMQEGG